MTGSFKQVLVVCDGSSLANQTRQRRAAAVAILEYAGRRKIVGEFLGLATNQQAEIVAACLGLEVLRERCDVTVLSDSEYVIRTMRGEYKRRTNLGFWDRLGRAASRHNVTWNWTRGHAGHELQEKCDRAARLIARLGSVDQTILDQVLSASDSSS